MSSDGTTAVPEVLARFPNGTFLENLVRLPDGTVLFTSYFARRIEAWSAAVGARMLAEVPLHPVSLAILPEGGLALAGHGASFTGGPAALRGTGEVVLLAEGGAVRRRIALPEAVFPNGCLLLAPDRLLLADSALGRVWLVDLAAGAAAPWLDHPSLAPDPSKPYPGVNGIKRAADGRSLLLSNSATRQLLRVGLAADGTPTGAPEAVAEMPFGIDDFALAPDGTLYAATHAEGIAVLPPGAATPRRIPAPGVEGSTAVLVEPDGRSLLALGTGGLTAGGKGEAVLARLAL